MDIDRTDEWLIEQVGMIRQTSETLFGDWKSTRIPRNLLFSAWCIYLHVLGQCLSLSTHSPNNFPRINLLCTKTYTCRWSRCVIVNKGARTPVERTWFMIRAARPIQWLVYKPLCEIHCTLVPLCNAEMCRLCNEMSHGLTKAMLGTKGSVV